jgi:hypothetical protein
VTVDRSQWMLEIAASADSQFVQYDLAVAAHSGSSYGDCFPNAGTRALSGRLPVQLPEGVSWRATLPGILSWLRGPEVMRAVEQAQRECNSLMFGGRPNR